MRVHLRSCMIFLGCSIACLYITISLTSHSIFVGKECPPTSPKGRYNSVKSLPSAIRDYNFKEVRANPKEINRGMREETEAVFAVDRAKPEEVLVEDYVPNTLYYIFCQQKELWFNQYMALLSAIRHIRPENILFYYDLTEPVLEQPWYNRFYLDLKDEFPFLRSIKVNTSVACNSAMQPKMAFVYDLLFPEGGWYIHETSMITYYDITLSNYSLIDGLDKNTGHGFMAAKRGLRLDLYNMNITALKTNPTFTTKTLRCYDNNTYNIAPQSNKPLCINIPNRFYPRDIMALDSDFGKLARLVFYKNSSLPVPVPNSEELIPNIAHMIWLGGGEMNYLFYLSVLSVLYVVEVDRLYLHGDGPPTGEYWEKLRHHPKITRVYTRRPETVYGTPVQCTAHVTDLMRVEFMIKYGGIYVDTDILFVQKLTREQRSYDAIASFDWTLWNEPFPDVINFGLTAGKRNAKFWHLFRETFRAYIESDWYYNGLSRPYQVWERHPTLLKIDPRLQVMCYQNKCHPTWLPDYHDGSVDHTPFVRDFKKDTHSFHHTFPIPDEYLNETMLRAHNNTYFGQQGYYILQRAGLA